MYHFIRQCLILLLILQLSKAIKTIYIKLQKYQILKFCVIMIYMQSLISFRSFMILYHIIQQNKKKWSLIYIFFSFFCE